MNPSLFTVESLSGVMFLGFVAITLAGALIAAGSRRLIRSVAGLALCFIGVAGLYYYLNSPFLALMQILIYVGAVCVTIIFAIMLAEPDELKRTTKRSGFMGFLSFVVSALLVWGVSMLVLKEQWKQTPLQINKGSVEDIGQSLLTTYSMSFELVSVVLLAAILGSLVLARKGRNA